MTLVSLSPSIPDRLIGHELAQWSQAQTEEPVLLVELGSVSSGVSLQEFGTVAPRLNGEFCFAERLLDGEGGFKRLQVRMSGGPE